MTVAIGQGETLDWSYFYKYRVTFLPWVFDWRFHLLILRKKENLRRRYKEIDLNHVSENS
jgi:hypothetical protein